MILFCFSQLTVDMFSKTNSSFKVISYLLAKESQKTSATIAFLFSILHFQFQCINIQHDKYVCMYVSIYSCECIVYVYSVNPINTRS